MFRAKPWSLLLLWFVHCCTKYTYYTISCGDIASHVVGILDTHHSYTFILDDAYNVNIDTCFSFTDIELNITKFTNTVEYVLANSSCPYGDWCGTCSNQDAYYAENFTIPMEKGSYTIEVTPYNLSYPGSYKLKIKCGPINSNHTNLVTSVPNNITTTKTYTTFTPSQSDDCDYYTGGVYAISQSNKILDSITISNNSIELVMYIKLHGYCDAYLCNIFHIFNPNEYIETLSLSISGGNEYFEIFSQTDSNIITKETHIVPNASTLLPMDELYHELHLRHTFKLNSGSIYNENILIIDGVVSFYYTTYSLTISPKQEYSLYISSPFEFSLNATVSSLCVKTSLNKEIYKETQCGKTVAGRRYTYNDIDYIYINISNDTAVLFDGSESLFRAHLTVQDMHQNLWGIGVDTLFIKYLPVGRYRLQISDYQDSLVYPHNDQWVMHIICDTTNINVYDTSNYKLVRTNSAPLFASGQDDCERLYGTSLATIRSNDDFEKALKDISDQWTLSPSYLVNISIWIGLYRDTEGEHNWKWLDGHNCGYTTTGYCIDDPRWIEGQPDGEPYSIIDVKNTAQFGTVLHIPQFGLPGYYDVPLEISNIYWSLCNAPHSKYGSPTNCTDDINCWNVLDCCDDEELNIDTNFDRNQIRGVPGQYEFYPPIVFWDSKIFIVGLHEIHYTNVNLLSNQYDWKHMIYNYHNLTTYKLAQRYAQYQSFLYLYAFDFSLGDTLIHIDLDNGTMKFIPIPSNYPSIWSEFDYFSPHGFYIETYCLVAFDKYVFIIRYRMIFIYDLESKQWNQTSFEDTEPMACAMTNDHEYIYVFVQTGSFFDLHNYRTAITKYAVGDKSITTLESINICSFVSEYVKAITGRDGKIYIHGCYAGSWQTMIFNTNKEKFERETINIDIPSISSVPYYRGSQLAVFDDNILLLFHKIYDEYPTYSAVSSNDLSLLYYAITYSLSINFTSTTPEIPVWPSEGILIKYYLNDFHLNESNGIYDVLFYSNSTTNNINAAITLNVSNDNCLCNYSSYNCRTCYKHFDLTQHLSTSDNEIDQLYFVPVLHANTYSFNWLILPNIVSVPLQRCEILFTHINTTITNNNVLAHFAFELTSNCCSRYEMLFSLNIVMIVSSEAHTIHQLSITINENGTISCLVCPIKSANLTECLFCNDNQFIIKYLTYYQDVERFQISLESNSIDFKITTSNASNTVKYFEKGNDKFTNDYLYLLFLLIIPIIIIYIFYLLWKKAYNNAFVVDNALVLIIGISKFNGMRLQDLEGVSKNVADLKHLWKNQYNYDTFICNEDSLRGNKLQIQSFVDKHVQILESKTYKCVIVHIISHGSDKSFCSSDGKEIPIKFVQHELIEKATETKQLNLIKLIFVHGCQGHADYSVNLKNIKIGNRSLSIKNNTVNNINMSYESNCLIIKGNVTGRTMSDSGNFTKCICESFQNNLTKLIKLDLHTQMVEIGQRLEEITQHAELCNINGTIRFNQIRLEKCNDAKHSQTVNIELQSYENMKINKQDEKIEGFKTNKSIHDVPIIEENEIDKCMEEIAQFYDPNESITL